MNLESIREYCLAKPLTGEKMPFDDSTLVFTVAGKIFALLSLNEPEIRISLKCEPDRAQELRASYPQITPGYHLNKQHWNTIYVEGLSSRLILELIDHSYELIINGLPAKTKKEWGL